VAVGAVHTLLAAHLQTSFNRSLKDLGKQGRVAVILFFALIVPLVMVPALVGAGFAGFFTGQALHGTWAVYVIGGVFGLVPLVLGVSAGAVVGGSRRLAWESYRAFPVRPLSLFVAEMVSGLGDPISLAFMAGGLAFGAGLLVSRPSQLLLFLPLLLMSLLWIACIELLVGSLGRALVRRLRWLVACLGVLIWFSAAMGGTFARDGHRLRRAMDPETRARIEAVGRSALVAFRALPGTQAAAGMAEATRGDWAGGVGRQAYPLAFTLVLLGATYALLLRETAPGATSASTSAPASRSQGWTFRSPAAGIARLHWHLLIRSQIGRFGFLFPLFTVVLLRGPARHFGMGPWGIPAAFAYISLVSAHLHFNQFGLDGPGIKTLLLLPIPARSLLLGKLGGMALHQGLLVALLALMLALLMRPAPSLLAAGVFLSAAIFVAHSAAGHWVSVWQPRRLFLDKMKSGSMPLAAVIVHLGLTLVNAAVFGGTWTLVSLLAPRWLWVSQLVLLALAAAAYVAALPFAARYLERNHERLAERLS
jgi:hypothetical protein